MIRASERFGSRLTRVALVTLTGLVGCDLAPSYRPPHYVLPGSFQGDGPFAVAQPSDLALRGQWWAPFDDGLLDQLEEQLVVDNPDLAAMTEAYTQARDLVAEARAGLFPQLSAGALLSYQRESQNKPFRDVNSAAPVVDPDNQVGFNAVWEPDIWSEVRNRVRNQSRLAQASAATLAGLRLSLQAELASDYVALRGADTEVAIYRSAIVSYRQAVEITTLRFNGKIASGIDVQRAKSQLAVTQELLEGSLSSRALLQHAIATLAGDNPSSFSIASEDPIHLTLREVPAVVPSALLERRPDIAAAERAMAAANAAIGVARAAFYPNISIGGTAGFEDTGFNLASLPNSFWSIGASATEPLFEGGLRRAELQQSGSKYAQTRDEYRSTVLSAFKEVEDGLAQTTHLRAQVLAQSEAVTAADKAQSLAMQLYIGGLTNYLDVVVAQETALSAHIAAAQLWVQQFQAEIGLIRALGGGWSRAELPTEKDVVPFGPLDYHLGRQPATDSPPQ
jgi:NodT family efflux transporter outer membrane factor (OMF) lipoprotein